MEFKGIPHGQLYMGHLHCPDTTIPTLEQKPIKVTSFQELDEFMKKQDIKPIDYTDLEDIDDTMDIDLARIGLVGCNVPEIPEGYNPSDTEMKQSIQKAIQATEEYLKQEEKNETNC